MYQVHNIDIEHDMARSSIRIRHTCPRSEWSNVLMGFITAVGDVIYHVPVHAKLETGGKDGNTIIVNMSKLLGLSTLTMIMTLAKKMM